MTIRPAALAVALALLSSLPSQAKDAKVGQVTLALTAPPGHCELDPSKPGDAHSLEFTQNALTAVGNRLLAFYADCKQLTDWRAGKRGQLEDFSQYQTTVAAIDAPAPPAGLLKEICSRQREEGQKTGSGLMSDVKSRVEEAVRGVQINQIRLLGVVAEEPGACYSALVQRLKSEAGRDVTIMALFATMFVRGKLVYYYLYSPYRSTQTVTALLARHKLNVAALLAANKQ